MKWWRSFFNATAIRDKIFCSFISVFQFFFALFYDLLNKKKVFAWHGINAFYVRQLLYLHVLTSPSELQFFFGEHGFSIFLPFQQFSYACTSYVSSGDFFGDSIFHRSLLSNFPRVVCLPLENFHLRSLLLQLSRQALVWFTLLFNIVSAAKSYEGTTAGQCWMSSYARTCGMTWELWKQDILLNLLIFHKRIFLHFYIWRIELYA